MVKQITREEIKELITNIGFKMVIDAIPEGDCPYSYYGNKESVRTCGGSDNNLDCAICRAQFYRNMMRKIQSEVNAW